MVALDVGECIFSFSPPLGDFVLIQASGESESNPEPSFLSFQEVYQQPAVPSPRCYALSSMPTLAVVSSFCHLLDT